MAKINRLISQNQCNKWEIVRLYKARKYLKNLRPKAKIKYSKWVILGLRVRPRDRRGKRSKVKLRDRRNKRSRAKPGEEE